MPALDSALYLTSPCRYLMSFTMHVKPFTIETQSSLAALPNMVVIEEPKIGYRADETFQI